MIKILHTADFHIGASFQSFAIDLLENHLQTIDNIVMVANTHKVDVILICGDVFDNQSVDFTTRERVFNILSKFQGKVFICCGNHDYFYTGSFWIKHNLPENIYLFRENHFEKLEFDNFNIYGASFTNIYEEIDMNIDIDDKINIAMVHSDILTKSYYNALSKEQISKSGLDYLALGHNHAFSDILKAGTTSYACSGNPMATGFDEKGEKGVIIASISKEKSEFEFISVNGLEVFDVKIDISSCKNNHDIENLMKKYSGMNKYISFELIGIKNFEQKIELDKSDFFKADIHDKTKLPKELWEHIDQDNLVGEFTRILRTKYQQNQESEILNALEIGLNALKN